LRGVGDPLRGGGDEVERGEVSFFTASMKGIIWIGLAM
jgi:hypothetical protein